MSDLIKTKEDYRKVLMETTLETAGYIQKFPQMGIYQTIGEELKEVGDILYVEKRLPTFIEHNLTSFGGIAAKNLEDDPEYARKLVELSYYFEFYSELK